MPKYLSLAEAAASLGLSRQTVIALVKSKGLPGFYLSRRWKFLAEDIETFVRAARRTS